MPAPAASTGRVSAADSPSVCSPAAHVCDCDVRDGRRDREASTHTQAQPWCVLSPIRYTVLYRWVPGWYSVLGWNTAVCIVFYFTVHILYYTKLKKPHAGDAGGFFISAHYLSLRPLSPLAPIRSRLFHYPHLICPDTAQMYEPLVSHKLIARMKKAIHTVQGSRIRRLFLSC